MCLKTPQTAECDCYECVEARSGRDRCCRGESGGPDALAPWRDAFQQAYHEVQVEVCKAKIKAKMSKTMDKTADLLLESMLAEIGENARRARFDKELREKLAKLVE